MKSTEGVSREMIPQKFQPAKQIGQGN